ncbi:MAG: CinA family nicotinamide mononucleotide deamidase-related protein, partial [Pseudomonadota bacterium]
GLGPTEDDVNRPVAADVLGRPLREVEEIGRRIEERYARLGRAMPENNLRQALVPEGAEWMENKKGTAPGLWVEHDGVVLILLPGPPSELEPMFEAECLPRLARLSTGRKLRSRVYKVTGLPESEVDERIAPTYTAYSNPVTTILAAPGAVEIHLRSSAPTEEEADALLAELGDKIEVALGDHVYSTRGESLEEVVGLYLVMKQRTVATAESCTGGLLGERLTRVPGSSSFFLGGAICYSNNMKTKLAGVPAALIETHGAVSKPVAQAMAEGIRARAGASYGIGVTGVAGPGGGTPEKPVGLVFIAVADEHSTQVREFRFPGDRERIRLWATQASLELIRRRVRA